MLTITASTSVQTMISTELLYSPLNSIISEIMGALNSRFPGEDLSFSFRKDTGCDIYINNIDLFLSKEFDQFLDTIASRLDDAQYMLLDFVPGYLRNNIFSKQYQNIIISPQSDTVTVPKALVEGRGEDYRSATFFRAQPFIVDVIDAKAA